MPINPSTTLIPETRESVVEMDQDAINLAKAIRQKESGGNFSAKGDAGTSKGGYQWQPQTWKEHSKRILGVDNAQMTPENQNAVAYGMIKTWKDQGMNPAQIAAKWNSGSHENWENKVGVNIINGQRIKYNVPQYVKEVTDTYQTLKQQDALKQAQTQKTTLTTTLSQKQQADAISKEQTGSVFGANTENPSVIGESLKTLANIPKSAWSFAKGAIDMLNPVNAIKNVAETKKLLEEESARTGENPLSILAKSFTETPKSTYEVLVPEAGKGVVQGAKGLITGDMNEAGAGFERAQRAVVNDPVGSIAPFLLAAEGGAKALGKQKAFNKAISKTAETVTKPAGYIFGKAKQAVSAPADLGYRTTEQILQPRGGDVRFKEYQIKEGAKALSNIDTKGVKTYSDLSSRLGEAIDSRLKNVDKIYESSKKGPIKLTDLKQTVESEIGGIKTKSNVNYVKEALTGLKELYSKTRDVSAKNRIDIMIKKAKTEGLTPAEINKISREWGYNFKGWRDTNGQPLTSVNGRAYENIRKGLKTTARQFLETPEAQALDKNTSTLITTKKMIDRVNMNVENLTSKIYRRNIFEKIGRGIVSAGDIATFGVGKSLIRGVVNKLLVPSNIGWKQMNSLEIQNALSKNLKTLRKLNGMPDNMLASAIKDLVARGGEIGSAVNKLPEEGVKPLMDTMKKNKVSDGMIIENTSTKKSNFGK